MEKVEAAIDCLGEGVAHKIRNDKGGWGVESSPAGVSAAASPHDTAMGKRWRALLLTVALSPWQQARGFNPPCNARHPESKVNKPNSRRQVRDDGEWVLLLLDAACHPPRTSDVQQDLFFPS